MFHFLYEALMGRNLFLVGPAFAGAQEAMN